MIRFDLSGLVSLVDPQIRVHIWYCWGHQLSHPIDLDRPVHGPVPSKFNCSVAQIANGSIGSFEMFQDVGVVLVTLVGHADRSFVDVILCGVARFGSRHIGPILTMM